MRSNASIAGIETFEDHLRTVNLAGARLAFVLSAIMIPATGILDWISIPELAPAFLAIRLGTSAIALLGLWCSYWPPLTRHPVALGAVPPLLCATAIELMILELGGPASPYYAGLNLCILAVAVLYTWRWQTSLLVNGLIILLWVIPGVPQMLLPGADYHAAFNNFVFLVNTAVISVASAVIRYRSAEREHRVRTELGETSSELTETLVQLQEHDRLKNEFFANISHELRTPLTLILSPVEDLLTRDLDEPTASPLRIVRRNAQRLLRLIDDLLDLARLDGGGLRLNVANVNLKDLAMRVVEATQPTASTKGISLQGPDTDVPSDVFGDPHRLEIILTNLVSNALKFTPRDGAIVVFTQTDDESVTVGVRDSGPGIAAENIERIFDRFYQVEGSERRSQGGAGIGLSLAKSLTELHGGALTVESRLGEGATFHMKLRRGTDHLDAEIRERRRVRVEAHPGRRSDDQFRAVRPDAAPTSPAPVKGPDLGDIRLARGRRARILVAEDEKDLRDFIVTALTNEFDVISAADGEQALEAMRRERPDLLLTDVMMPKRSGTELCRAVKEDKELRTTPVILLTARSSTDSALEGYSSGADDFIAKPFHTRVLIARVKAQLRLRALGLQLADQSRLASASALAAGLAHEVKNPLNALLNAARALPEVPEKSPKAVKLLEAIVLGARRIADIISVLEEHVRPADGGEKSICDLESGLSSTLKLLDYRLAQIHVDYSPGKRHLVVASGRELNQVLLNLLDNAVKAGPRNIWIDVQQRDRTVQLSISDDGRGVARDIEHVIFEPFFTTGRAGEGSGLGLYLARRIVTEYGGDLAYRARPGGGSTFQITLPAFQGVA